MTAATPRPDAPPHAPPSLTVDETAQRYELAGVPRTIRRIQKYCARGDLDCRKVETESGEKYLISAESIDRHVAQIRDALAAAGRAQARPDALGRSMELKEISETKKSAPTDAQSRPNASGRDYQSVYLEHLEKENSFLREQNTVLLERVKETNILTGRLQEMLRPLLGGGEAEGDKSINSSKGGV
jgi:hypothetical protein